MKRRHDFDAAKVPELAAHTSDSLAHFKEIAQRGVSHHDDHFWLNGCDFTKEKWPADRSFLERWLAIAWRPATIDVADDHVFTFDSHRFDHLGEQLSVATAERPALSVFVGSWCFAHEHQ